MNLDLSNHITIEKRSTTKMGFFQPSAFSSGFFKPPSAFPMDLSLSSGSIIAGYSIRKLRSAYSGSALAVRRSSDNAEQDIGFSGTGLDTAALLSFVGANNGLVKTMYDQSTGGVNVTQGTAGLQPGIVASGTLNTLNGFAAPKYDGSDDYLVNALSVANSCTIFVVTANHRASLIGATVDPAAATMTNGVGTKPGCAIDTYNGFASTATRQFLGEQGNPGTTTVYKNGSTSPVTLAQNELAVGTIKLNSSTTSTAFSIGAFVNGNSPSMNYVLEVLIFSNQLSDTDRLAVERNIGAYYGITVA